MPLHRRKTPVGPARLFAAPAVTGVTLAALTVAGLAVATDTRADGVLLAAEYGLGAGLLMLALAGLFTCAAFATSFSGEAEEPRGGSARPLRAHPIPVRIAARADHRSRD
ncbi:hypothetical protein PQJ75_21570 [Rhodoplanes sp. TEM]|uniref:Uncharacterized protein n=1 Tax=Rhodoplanes tepidamans TaxID=200616 RepID=A0ABT5JBM0_RHOTP|nr:MULTISPECIES: hypothetical protein [Rhodoplanes]MDC7787081.1 hypothetical protein [Rhodoplanes tepidamans]MDC7986326.1 hypothetical protein [Rhodoplanes sp. TEM]MDQ0358681.1 hypothetical protein [Rhodoplanes tepidamans]